MSATIVEPSKSKRMTPTDEGVRKVTDLTKADTPLSAVMDETSRARFLRYVCQDWTHQYGSLHPWRQKMEKWERMSEMDYTDRKTKPDPNNTEQVLDAFAYQNDTLGMSEGFVDFAAAQAKDDIFGTRPWLAATPEGRNDPKLADQVTKHAQWKLNQSDLEEAILDGIRVACWGGTAFLKSRWVRETETFRKPALPVAFSKKSGEPYLAESGDSIRTAEELDMMGVDGADVEWKDQSQEEVLTVYDNSRSSCVDYRDIAFNAKAPQLDLAFTPVYCRFRMGILDAISYYKIPEERHHDLELALIGYDEEARTNRGESNTTPVQDDPFESNQEISLVEGFIRYDPFKTGKPIRIHCVFSPTLQILFSLDYLANVTPEGMLPVFPVRIGKIPRRVFGIGYFEKYETANNAVDRQHNSVLFRNKLSAQVITGIHKDALLNPQNNTFVVDSRTPVELAVDKKLSDFIEFAAFPDLNDRSIELMNHMLQMAQMRSGISSAAQGELKGVPNASTATGVNQLTSRGALLLKDPISQITSDVQPLVEFNVHLLYANQNRDETFTWGEGEAAELLTIEAGDVQGLRMNVTLKLVQSQNQSKLANAQAAIGIITGYVQMPETDKTAARPLFVQALEALGFNNSEDIVRQAVTDPAGIMAIMPPDIAPIVEAALVQAGVLSPPAQPATEASGSAPAESPSTPSAPVTENPTQ